MHTLVSALVFCLLTLSSVVLHVPQLVALARSGNPAGLSASALLAGVVNYTAWTVYLWSSHSWLLLVTNLLASVAWYAIAALALPRLRPTGACALPAVWLVVVAGVGITDPTLLGPLLGVGSLLMFVPQAISAWTLPSLAGLSPTTWALSAAQGVAWFAQSLPEALVGGLLFGVVATAGSASVLAAMVVRGRGTTVAPAAVPDLVSQELTVTDILRAGTRVAGGDLVAS
jgi:uncharacterized protein with PQ loop repeat